MRIATFRVETLIAAALFLAATTHAVADKQDIDPRGPLTVSGIQGRLMPGGVAAPGYQPAKDLKSNPVWSASWVWLAPEADAPKSSVACFRKEVTFAADPVRVIAWVSADRHYRAYVNGRLVARGPADPGEDYPSKKSGGKSGLYFADFCDLTSFLHRGKNVISVEVFNDRLSEWWGSSGSNGLFFQADGVLKDHSTISINTDESWRSHPGEYLQTGRDLTYIADKEPMGWRFPGFDDSSWPACAKVENHWQKLLPSELSQPMEIVYPIMRVVQTSPGLSIPAAPFREGRGVILAADGEFTLQYNRVLPAYAGLKIKGGAGATVTMDFSERNGSPRHACSIVLRDGVQYFETPYYTSFAYLRIRVSGVKTPIEIEDVRATFTTQPVDYKGSFSCSDESLNQLWTASRWGTQICMQDRYLDSPDHQEPISDPGDYLIESLVNYYTFHEPELTRQDLRKFGGILANNDYVNFHTSYSLLWLQMLMDYYDYTGDVATVLELAPQVHGLLNKFTGWRGKNGLISEAPDYMFMDWVNIAGFGTHHPPAVIGQGYLTAFYYRGLLDGHRVAEIAGDHALMERYEGLRREVAESYNRELWNPEKQLYLDGKPFQTSVKPAQWLPADKDIATFSSQNNSLAVLYDLAPREKQAGIMQRLTATNLNAQPYFMHFVLSALAHAGLFDRLALPEMSRWKIEPVTQTFSEMWDGGDLSHGWGGTPLYQMGSQILGVTPLAPGFRRLAVHPVLCDLKWAKGKVPTPHGNVEVSWALTATGMQFDVKIPPGTEADVALPITRFANPKITLAGRECPGGHADNLAPGNYHFKLSGKLLTLDSTDP